MVRPTLIGRCAMLIPVLCIPALAMAQETPPAPTASPAAPGATPPPSASPAPSPTAAPPPSAYPAPAAYPPAAYPPGAYPPAAYPPAAYPPAAAAYYPPPVAGPTPGSHTHDGFYFRYNAGPGYLFNSAPQAGSTLKVSGVGFSGSLALGAVIADNLALYGQIVGAILSNPTVEFDGQSDTADGLDVNLAGIGPGIAYYFAGNSYLAGTIALTQLTARTSRSRVIDSEAGFGATLAGGKEWWVSDNWGLGIAGQILFASMKEKDADYRWSSLSLAVLFSATYN